MVTAVCNVYINSDHKFEKFRETFPSVYDVSDNWLIYIRGKFSPEVNQFIKKLHDHEKRCTFFIGLYDNDWAKSTRHMLQQSRYDYVYIFLEDHFLLPPLTHFKSVLTDMIDHSLDYFSYSFFNLGLGNYSVGFLHPEETPHFQIFTYDTSKEPYFKKWHPDWYPFSLVAVSSKQYFEKLLAIESLRVLRVPYKLQAALEMLFGFRAPRNRHFWWRCNRWLKYVGIRLTIYSPATPFNLEKSLYDCNNELLPLKVGILKQELFANWDDDNGVTNSSLIKRGLYPKQFLCPHRAPNQGKGDALTLVKGDKKEYRHFASLSRCPIPIKTIKVTKGVLKIVGREETYTVKTGETITFYANIPHTLEAIETAACSVWLANQR